VNLNSKNWTALEVLSILVLVMLTIWGFYGHLEYQIVCGVILLSVVVLGFVLRKKEGLPVIICGDLNVAHEEIDLARPGENRNNIMFTEKERNQIDEIVDLGFIDTFRRLNSKGGHYSWWPYRVDARQRNIGWRIDYVFISKGLISRLKDAFILSKVMGSDHCPVGIEIA